MEQYNVPKVGDIFLHMGRLLTVSNVRPDWKVAFVVPEGQLTGELLRVGALAPSPIGREGDGFAYATSFANVPIPTPKLEMLANGEWFAFNHAQLAGVSVLRWRVADVVGPEAASTPERVMSEPFWGTGKSPAGWSMGARTEVLESHSDVWTITSFPQWLPAHRYRYELPASTPGHNGAKIDFVAYDEVSTGPLVEASEGVAKHIGETFFGDLYTVKGPDKPDLASLAMYGVSEDEEPEPTDPFHALRVALEALPKRDFGEVLDITQREVARRGLFGKPEFVVDLRLFDDATRCFIDFEGDIPESLANPVLFDKLSAAWDAQRKAWEGQTNDA